MISVFKVDKQNILVTLLFINPLSKVCGNFSSSVELRLSDWCQALIEMFLGDLSILQVGINHTNRGQFIIL